MSNKKNNKKVSIQEMYSEYLKQIKLPESEMHPEQKRQLKQAFFAGVGALYLFINNDTVEMTDKQIEQMNEDLLLQITTFWNNEIQSQN